MRVQGKARQAEYIPTAAEEKATARARAQGLDELLPLSPAAVRAGKGVDEQDDDALASPTSPAGTDLPEYPASPARGALRRKGTTAKRVVERDEEEVYAGEDKRAQAEAEVRASINDDAQRTVQEDAVASKAALARRAEQEERERGEGEARRREREVEKGRAALGPEDAEAYGHDDDEPPPPISPDEHGREMFPLLDRKDPSSLDDLSADLPPPPPATSCHPVRYATLASSMRSELYPGAVASSTSSEHSFSHASGPVRPEGARHGSLGPAHSFYSTGVGQVTLKSLEERQQLVAPVLRASTSSSTVPLSHDADAAAARRHVRPSWSASSEGAAPVPPTMVQQRLQPPLPYLARSMTASSSMSASSGDSGYGGALSFSASTSSHPPPSSSREWQQRVPAPPSPAPPRAPQPWASTSSHAPAPSPAFYTSLHPGGPLLPFYAAPSTSPGQRPSSYISPAGALGLPPPPTPPVFAPLAHAPSPYSQPPSQGGAAYPFPGAATSYAAPPPASAAGSPAPRSQRGSPAPPHSQATSPRPWSRSSSAPSPPPPGAERAAGAGVREKRMSSIRGLFGRRKGGAVAGELAGMPEEEDEGARMAGQGWR
ncbi:hypothetical protein JCM9279_005033 [Rhodotorula babjevae]